MESLDQAGSHSSETRCSHKGRFIRLHCEVPGCSRVFKNKSGLMKHTRTRHPTHLQNRLSRSFHQAAPTFSATVNVPSQPSSPAHQDLDFDARSATQNETGSDGGFVPEDSEGTGAELNSLFHVFHPHLTGLCILLHTA